jgi:N-carbamoylputrescine amidase
VTKERVVTLGLPQLPASPDPDANLKRAVQAVHEAADKGAQIVCLQELYRSQYFCQVEDPAFFDLAETKEGPTAKAMSEAARKRGVVVVAPYFERRAAGVYHNSAMIFDADGSMVGHYRKMHIPDDPQYYEKFYFTPGDQGFKAIRTKFGVIGVLICWDQWFPEGARLTALAGAEILFYPTAIGWLQEDKPTLGEKQHGAWQTVQRGHAVANGVYVAACNRVGWEGAEDVGIEFWGRSFVADPQGEVIAQAGEKEETLIARCDLSRVESTRRLWPFFRDRRVDAYQGVLERYLD